MNPLMQEELEYEFNARYDSISEAYAATAADCNEMARQDAEYEREQFAAFIGPHKPFGLEEIPF